MQLRIGRKLPYLVGMAGIVIGVAGVLVGSMLGGNNYPTQQDSLDALNTPQRSKTYQQGKQPPLAARAEPVQLSLTEDKVYAKLVKPVTRDVRALQEYERFVASIPDVADKMRFESPRDLQSKFPEYKNQILELIKKEQQLRSEAGMFSTIKGFDTGELLTMLTDIEKKVQLAAKYDDPKLLGGSPESFWHEFRKFLSHYRSVEPDAGDILRNHFFSLHGEEETNEECRREISHYEVERLDSRTDKAVVFSLYPCMHKSRPKSGSGKGFDTDFEMSEIYEKPKKDSHIFWSETPPSTISLVPRDIVESAVDATHYELYSVKVALLTFDSEEKAKGALKSNSMTLDGTESREGITLQRVFIPGPVYGYVKQTGRYLIFLDMSNEFWEAKPRTEPMWNVVLNMGR